MHITVSGTPGSGKSTLIKSLSALFNMDIISASKIQRGFAESLGMNIDEFQSFLTNNMDKASEYDTKTDQYIGKISELREHESILFDSRLAFFFVKDSYNISLTCCPDEAAKRIYNSRKDKEPQYTNIETTKKLLKSRLNNEIVRYEKLYKLNYTDPSNFHLVIDTTEMTEEVVLATVLDDMSKYVKLELENIS